MICIVLFNPSIVFSSSTGIIGDVQTLNNQIEAKVLAFKKTKYYTAVEIGFTNPTGNYLEFTPTEIYLDDAVKYSQPLLTQEQMRYIERHKPSHSLLPLALGVGLGISALAVSPSNSDAAYGLGIAALGMGGAALLTSGFDDAAKQKKLISFENNSLSSIDKIPPGMTLGGVLYFSPTKKPVSITLIAKSRNGGYEKKVFSLEKKKKH